MPEAYVANHAAWDSMTTNWRYLGRSGIVRTCAAGRRSRSPTAVDKAGPAEDADFTLQLHRASDGGGRRNLDRIYQLKSSVGGADRHRERNGVAKVDADRQSFAGPEAAGAKGYELAVSPSLNSPNG